MEKEFLYRIKSELGDGANNNGNEKDWNICRVQIAVLQKQEMFSWGKEVGEVAVP